MKRILRLCLYMMMLGSTLLGCQQGVTDVGNPTVTAKPPAVQQPDAPSDPNTPSSPAPGNPSPSTFKFPSRDELMGTYQMVASETDCEATPNASPKIISGNSPTQLVLQEFFPSSQMQTVAIDYVGGSFSIENTDTDVSCTGTAAFANSKVKVVLSCVQSKMPCTRTFLKN